MARFGHGLYDFWLNSFDSYNNSKVLFLTPIYWLRNWGSVRTNNLLGCWRTSVSSQCVIFLALHFSLICDPALIPFLPFLPPFARGTTGPREDMLVPLVPVQPQISVENVCTVSEGQFRLQSPGVFADSASSPHLCCSAYTESLIDEPYFSVKLSLSMLPSFLA